MCVLNESQNPKVYGDPDTRLLQKQHFPTCGSVYESSRKLIDAGPQKGRGIFAGIASKTQMGTAPFEK